MPKRKERPPKDDRPKEKRHRHGGRKGRRGLAGSAGRKRRVPGTREDEARLTIPSDSENRE